MGQLTSRSRSGKHGLVQDNAKVAEKIRELFRLTKTTNKKVVAGLSDPLSLYRIVTLPKLPEAILPEAIKREAERVIPLSLDEVYLIHQVIGTKEQEMTSLPGGRLPPRRR